MAYCSARYQAISVIFVSRSSTRTGARRKKAATGCGHCIVLCAEPTAQLARRYGPLIESHPRFPHRINVQFMKQLDNNKIYIEIWERGAGYTLASGSSSTAAAAVAYRLGLCGPEVTVHMPGGTLALRFRPDFYATMTGPVTRVCEGVIDAEMFAGKSETGCPVPLFSNH